jgi:hypothetical protein
MGQRDTSDARKVKKLTDKLTLDDHLGISRPYVDTLRNIGLLMKCPSCGERLVMTFVKKYSCLTHSEGFITEETEFPPSRPQSLYDHFNSYSHDTKHHIEMHWSGGDVTEAIVSDGKITYLPEMKQREMHLARTSGSIEKSARIRN